MTADNRIQEMFDVPGPAGRQKIRVISIVSGLVLAVILGLAAAQFAERGGFERERWIIFTNVSVLKLLGEALLATLQAALVAGVISLVAAVLLAIGRTSQARFLAVPATAVIEVSRAVPTLLLLYVTILLLPTYGIRLPIFWQVVLALSVSNVGMFAEILRASILALSRGQTEAALSLGMSMGKVRRFVLLPQAFQSAMPALVAQMIFLLKTSTLGYVVSYEELLHTSRVIGEYSGFLLQSIIVIACVYFLLNETLAQLSFALERRLNRRKQVVVKVAAAST